MKMLYLVNTPWWVKRWVYPAYLWSMPRTEKKIYLSFDDGPHPVATPFILDELKKYNAKASFFCIGKNVAAHPDVYARILADGHATGNHTYDHVNGWKTSDRVYFDSINRAATYIDTKLFRPPYGRITRFQGRQVQERLGLRVVMWSVLSADFDPAITPLECWNNVKRSAGNGSIVVFHDSEKAMERMKFALSQTLSYFSAKGFSFEKLAGVGV
jgi:peptidoglycan-N-acetylglucosamine deacetylase